MNEMKPQEAEVIVISQSSRLRRKHKDIQDIHKQLLSLANDIEQAKNLTPWPQWSKNQADSMREYALQLENSPE